MNKPTATIEPANLVTTLNALYGLSVRDIHLHRDMIGSVYYADDGAQRFVLKLYRSFNRELALQSTRVIQYLRENTYPVAPIVATAAGEPCFELSLPDGPSVGILFDFVAGTEPNLETELERLAQQVGELHCLMAEYPGPLIRRGKDFYIDRFIAGLRQLRYDPARIADLESYGDELWASMERLPHGFCHGDLHTGNILQSRPNEYVLFDFDVASNTRSIIDVATLCDASDFNRLDEASFDATRRTFERFYTGYSRVRTLGDNDIAAIFDFIAVRHYELIATISECHGLDDLSLAFLDQQWDWLMRWREICRRKRA